MRWPEGPPHLALNPPYLFFFLGGFVFPFFSLLFDTKNCFSPRKGHFCLFLSLSLCFSLACLWPPPFSISLSLSLSCSFLFFFLLVFFCFLLVPFFCLFLPFVSSLLLFHERNNIKTFDCNLVFINSFSFFGFLSCFSFESLFLMFAFFPDFGLCFCST